MPEIITFEHVTKKYADNIGLDDVSVRINQGDFVFLVGPSGAGKSTFIKLILKEIEADSGSIRVKGNEVTTMSSRRIPEHRRNIGIVFQDFRLLPQKTVFENVAFAMEITHQSKRAMRRLVPQVLGLMGMADYAHRYPEELSAGEQQRVAIARAIVNKPNVLIADEPTGNLDPVTAWEIMRLLNEINKRGTTVVMVTHAKNIVDHMKKRVIVIEDGKIVRDEFGAYGMEEETTSDVPESFHMDQEPDWNTVPPMTPVTFDDAILAGVPLEDIPLSTEETALPQEEAAEEDPLENPVEEILEDQQADDQKAQAMPEEGKSEDPVPSQLTEEEAILESSAVLDQEEQTSGEDQEPVLVAVEEEPSALEADDSLSLEEEETAPGDALNLDVLEESIQIPATEESSEEDKAGSAEALDSLDLETKEQDLQQEEAQDNSQPTEERVSEEQEQEDSTLGPRKVLKRTMGEETPVEEGDTSLASEEAGAAVDQEAVENPALDEEEDVKEAAEFRRALKEMAKAESYAWKEEILEDPTEDEKELGNSSADDFLQALRQMEPTANKDFTPEEEKAFANAERLLK